MQGDTATAPTADCTGAEKSQVLAQWGIESNGLCWNRVKWWLLSRELAALLVTDTDTKSWAHQGTCSSHPRRAGSFLTQGSAQWRSWETILCSRAISRVLNHLGETQPCTHPMVQIQLLTSCEGRPKGCSCQAGGYQTDRAPLMTAGPSPHSPGRVRHFLCTTWVGSSSEDNAHQAH